VTTDPGSAGSDPYSEAQRPVPAPRPSDLPAPEMPPEMPKGYGWHGAEAPPAFGAAADQTAIQQPPSAWTVPQPVANPAPPYPAPPGVSGPTVVSEPTVAVPAGDTFADRAAPGPSKRGRHAEDRRAGWGGFLRELPILLIVGFGIVVLVKSFLIQAFYIPSGSMERTLLVNDRVLVNRQSYLFGEPQRGDVIVFRSWDDVGQDVASPSAWEYVTRSLREGIGLGPSGTKQDLIKRVIGLPGDTVEVRNSHAIVNGIPLDEPYVYLDGPDPLANFGPRVVPEGHYFMLGDHRNNSADSRAGGGRFTDEDAIVGRAFLRIWPPGRIGGLGDPPTPQAVSAHDRQDSQAVAVGMLLVVPAWWPGPKAGAAGFGRTARGGSRGSV